MICGLVSGTQPVTIMGLLLVSAGVKGRTAGWAYLGGAFLVETAVLLAASFVIGGTVKTDSDPGRWFLYIRILLGLALIVASLLLRRPPKKPQPEVPKSLARLQELSPAKAFVAGAVLADYQGPLIGSLAIASADVSLGGRFGALLVYTAVASGIPIAIFIVTSRSEKAHDKLGNGTTWVMQNRRRLASWVALIAGLFLAGDAALMLVSI